MIDPKHVHETLKRHQLADGYPFVFDLDRSHGCWLYDSRTDTEYLDTFTCFASWAIGYNHPGMADEGFRSELLKAALNNPSNADLYTTQMAEFVQTFARDVTPAGYPHHFWVSGGALAVENAMKAAFDWKARKIGLSNITDDGASLVILHFKQAFHGRSGYTLSVTNTVPDKTALFPKFAWPRVHNPAIVFDLDGHIANDIEAEEQRSLAEIDQAFVAFKNRIAAILVEPMQSEGGDNHFRPQFLAALRQIADEREALLVFDEVQTGFFGSGKPWLWQHSGVAPDIVAFGKKTQVCGIYANTRIDDVADNVFHKVSRINSTWGGNLTDMVRSRRIIEIIRDGRLMENVASYGARFLSGLREIARDHKEMTNVRGIGSLVSFTLPSPELRTEWLKRMREQHLLALACGTSSVRFRLSFVMGEKELEAGLARVAAAAEGVPAKAKA
ncbi:MAG: L-lysine 6-transaminase [Planctomycetes bacterium]|nr:L-lysine 6-transaminase [Planctomycetota bacterium]